MKHPQAGPDDAGQGASNGPLTLEEARARAEQAVRDGSDPEHPTAVGGNALESAHYWVFFYNTVEFWGTGEDLASLAGNGPVAVRKDGGELRWMTSARSAEEQLAEFEAAAAAAGAEA